MDTKSNNNNKDIKLIVSSQTGLTSFAFLERIAQYQIIAHNSFIDYIAMQVK